jgi:hypothetical protein
MKLIVSFACGMFQVILLGYYTDFGVVVILDFTQVISRTVLAFTIRSSVTTDR